MDQAGLLRIGVFILIAYVWMTFYRRERVKRVHWIFFAFVILVLPWTDDLGFVYTLLAYFGLYFIAGLIDRLLPTADKGENEGE